MNLSSLQSLFSRSVVRGPVTATSRVVQRAQEKVERDVSSCSDPLFADSLHTPSSSEHSGRKQIQQQLQSPAPAQRSQADGEASLVASTPPPLAAVSLAEQQAILADAKKALLRGEGGPTFEADLVRGPFDPKFEYTRLALLGLHQLLNGNYRKSVAAFNTILKNNPQDRLASVYKAIAWRRDLCLSRGRSTLQEGLSLDEYLEAIREHTKIAVDKNDAFARVIKRCVLPAVDGVERPKRQLEAIIEQFPDYVLAHSALAAHLFSESRSDITGVLKSWAIQAALAALRLDCTDHVASSVLYWLTKGVGAEEFKYRLFSTQSGETRDCLILQPSALDYSAIFFTVPLKFDERLDDLLPI